MSECYFLTFCILKTEISKLHRLTEGRALLRNVDGQIPCTLAKPKCIWQVVVCFEKCKQILENWKLLIPNILALPTGGFLTSFKWKTLLYWRFWKHISSKSFAERKKKMFYNSKQFEIDGKWMSIPGINLVVAIIYGRQKCFC